MGIQTDLRTNSQSTTPPRYKVLLLNDDYSTWDFVVRVLVAVFAKTADEAETITRAVHFSGAGVAGIYGYEIAEAKTEQANQMAYEEGQPLQCIMEPE